MTLPKMKDSNFNTYVKKWFYITWKEYETTACPRAIHDYIRAEIVSIITPLDIKNDQGM